MQFIHNNRETMIIEGFIAEKMLKKILLQHK